MLRTDGEFFLWSTIITLKTVCDINAISLEHIFASLGTNRLKRRIYNPAEYLRWTFFAKIVKGI